MGKYKVKTLKAERIKTWSLYIVILPLLLILIFGIEYLMRVYELVNGNYKYDFMIGADAIPTPWYMKTKELYVKYCLIYGSSLILMTIVYLVALIKRKKLVQQTIVVLSLLILYYEFNMFLDSVP